MTFKKITGKIHLWLGLASGLVVFIVGITGCCYVFIDEIQHIAQPWAEAEVRATPYITPSHIEAIVKHRTGKSVSYLNYTPGKAAYAGLFGKDYSYGVYLDPYTGSVQHITDFNHDFDFFAFVLNGHRALWLPYNIGSPIIDAGVLIFVVLLISGMVLWWPKNWKKANRDKSFKIKWTAKFKRLNYDLHNVLGFYAMLILFAIATTGLVWGYQWFARSVYWVTSAGTEAYPEYKSATSDTAAAATFRLATVDSLWLLHTGNRKNIGSSVSFPEAKPEIIEIGINYRPGTNYRQDFYDYDQYTLKPLKGQGIFAGSYSGASFADHVARMNYDIHTGQIGGLPTKIMAFFASLICATLPITGFYIWWGKKKKQRKRSCKSVKNKGNIKRFSAVQVDKQTIS